MQNPSTCPNCGATRRPTAHFCGTCGSKNAAIAVGLIAGGLALDTTVDHVQAVAADHVETIASYSSPEFAEKLSTLPEHAAQFVAAQAAIAEPNAVLESIADNQDIVDNAQEAAGSLIDFLVRLFLG